MEWRRIWFLPPLATVFMTGLVVGECSPASRRSL
jgi:hypothetical protein